MPLRYPRRGAGWIRTNPGSFAALVFLLLIPLFAAVVSVKSIDNAHKLREERTARAGAFCAYAHDRLAQQRRTIADGYIRILDPSWQRLFNLKSGDIQRIKRVVEKQFYHDNGNGTLPFYCMERNWPEKEPKALPRPDRFRL